MADKGGDRLTRDLRARFCKKEVFFEDESLRIIESNTRTDALTCVSQFSRHEQQMAQKIPRQRQECQKLVSHYADVSIEHRPDGHIENCHGPPDKWFPLGGGRETLVFA